jgi:predicted phosphodiesterase
MKKVLLLSDMHVGSKWGLWPPNFKAKSARSNEIEDIPQNAVNKAIWQHWLKMLATLKKEKPDIIILNGDLIEGDQRKEKGRGLVTPELFQQCAACIAILKTLPKVPMYFTAGTDYHQLPDGISADLYIADQMGGEYGDELVIEDCGLRIFARHTIGTSQGSWQYMTTAPAKEQMLLYLNQASDKYGKIDIAVFSHRHQFVSAQFSSGIALITPCWQGKTVFAVKKGIIAPPHIGWVSLIVDGPKRIAIDTSGIANVVSPCKTVGRDRK